MCALKALATAPPDKTCLNVSSEQTSSEVSSKPEPFMRFPIL